MQKETLVLLFSFLAVKCMSHSDVVNMRTQTGKIYKCLDRLRNLHICFIYFLSHQWTDERGRSVFIPLLIHHEKITDPVTHPPRLNHIYLSFSLRFTGPCHWKSWLRFFWVVLQEEAALLTGGALCGGLFPALTGSAHIGNRFSLRDDLRRSPAESVLSCPPKTEEGAEGGRSFETHPPHLTGDGGYSILYIFLFV